MRALLLLLLNLILGSLLLVRADAEARAAPGEFLIGTGIYDITGPAADVGMMGYEMINQIAHGIHTRLFARAFVFVDTVSNKRVVYVNLDLCMTFQMFKWKVIDKLTEKFGNLYTHENVLMSSIHTHSGPAGYSMYALYNLASLGFYADNFQVIVDGIFTAIVQAHNNVKRGKILINVGTLDKSNINRSPAAYLMDPLSERNQYQYNTDHDFTLLRLEDSNGGEIGMLNWFAVHCTSMNNTNELISSDNKGYAEIMFEKLKNGDNVMPGKGTFVAAFGQSNEGDVSPNTRGPSCPDGTPCDLIHSTCNGKSQGCIAKGPGDTDFQSVEIIGGQQLQKALDLYNSASTPLRGGVDYRHTWQLMTNISVSPNFTSTGKREKTCTGALGVSFAAGTTDGPGDFNFVEGTNDTHANPYWRFIAGFLAHPTRELKECQSPKPILLDVGQLGFIEEGLPWAPWILPLQMINIGQLYIVAVPGEFTTMSGRRLRNRIQKALNDSGVTDAIVVIAGLSNSYSHYIATYEEYHQQRYEGASTLYGPHTLAAYEQQYTMIAQALAQGKPVDPGTMPPDLTGHTFNFLPAPIPDEIPFGKKFGEVFQDAKSAYKVGDLVEVVFYGGNLRNNFMTNSSYLTVERNVNGQWQVVATDASWETKLHWKRDIIGVSHITISWQIPNDALAGSYRITHSGYHKVLFEGTFPYSGTTSAFQVLLS